MLGLLMQHLLPTPAVSPPRATPIPSDHEQLIQHLMGTEHPVHPVLQERSSLTDMEILLQSLLPFGLLEGENLRLAVDRHESTVVCFRVVSRAMRLCDDLFWMIRFLSCHRDGRRIGRAMDLFCDRPRRG